MDFSRRPYLIRKMKSKRNYFNFANSSTSNHPFLSWSVQINDLNKSIPRHIVNIQNTSGKRGTSISIQRRRENQNILLLLSHFNCFWLCATPSLGFSRQEHWSGSPFPSSIHKSEKWKWSCSVVSNALRPYGLQPTRLLRPWDFPGKSIGVGCHCLLRTKT